MKRATIKIDMTAENIAGVMLPIMHVRENEDSGKHKLIFYFFI